MYIISCFIIGYMIAREIRKRTQEKYPSALRSVILLLFAVIGVLAIYRELRMPGIHAWDYGLYKSMFIGRTAASAQVGAIVFILGMTVNALRSGIRTIAAQLAADRSKAAGPEPAAPPAAVPIYVVSKVSPEDPSPRASGEAGPGGKAE